MVRPKLALIQGSKVENQTAAVSARRPLNERMTKVDWVKKRIYSAISASSSEWLPFDMKLWALCRLNALHVKYDSGEAESRRP
ncbi:MAG: hypothetical protein WC835_00815 [Candidatus Paceibacterota bacterium]|jgi:hypothetical protein